MPVPDGGLGRSAGGRTTAPLGVVRYGGVWLIGEAWGHRAASPDVGLVLDTNGLTITGPADGQSSTLPWTWIRYFRNGAPTHFPDGTAATTVEVGMIGRSITLLVPCDQLRSEEIDDLNRYVPDVSMPAPEPHLLADPIPVADPIALADPIPVQEAPPEPAVAPSVADEPTVTDDPTVAGGVAPRRRHSVRARPVHLGLLLVVLVVGVACTVVIASRSKSNPSTAAVVVPAAPPTTLAPAQSSLTGPGATADPLDVAQKVNLKLSDLPQGWEQVHAIPFVSVPSPFSGAHTFSDKQLAACIRIPVSQVGILTGKTEPGGPQIWPSPTYVLNSGFHPSAISVAALADSPSAERSTLSSLFGQGTFHCLSEYYAASFASEHVTGTPVVSRFSVPQHDGEQIIGLDVHIGTSQDGHRSVYDYDVVVIGAGRLEIALGAQQDFEPFSQTTLARALQGVEARAVVAAGGS